MVTIWRTQYGGHAGEPVLNTVLDGSALPPQPLLPQGAPGGHHLGGQGAVLRRQDPESQVHECERDLVVLREHGGVVDPACAVTGRQDAAQAGLAHGTQRAHTEHRRRAGDHQALAPQASHVASVPGELVALQVSDEAAAGLPAEHAADRAQHRVVLQVPQRALDELRVEGAVGVLDEDEVVGGQGREQRGERLVERPGLLRRVGDGLRHSGTCSARHLDRGVGAVVGDDQDLVRATGLGVQRGDRLRERLLFVVRRHDDDHACHGVAGVTRQEGLRLTLTSLHRGLRGVEIRVSSEPWRARSRERQGGRPDCHRTASGASGLALLLRASIVRAQRRLRKGTASCRADGSTTSADCAGAGRVASARGSVRQSVGSAVARRQSYGRARR